MSRVVVVLTMNLMMINFRKRGSSLARTRARLRGGSTLAPINFPISPPGPEDDLHLASESETRGGDPTFIFKF